MTDKKNHFANIKVDTKTGITIIILSLAALFIQIYSTRVNFEPKEFDENLSRLLFSITISLFGIVFTIIAHKEWNKYLVRAFGLVFVGMLPLLSFLPLILNSIFNFVIFFSLSYFGITFGWYFGVKHLVIGRVDDDKKESAVFTIKKMLMYFIIIGIGAIALYLVAFYFFNLASVIDS